MKGFGAFIFRMVKKKVKLEGNNGDYKTPIWEVCFIILKNEGTLSIEAMEIS